MNTAKNTGMVPLTLPLLRKEYTFAQALQTFMCAIRTAVSRQLSLNS